MEFTPFPKMPRLMRDIVVTEKIDGTNASITITEEGLFLTASRNRYVVPGDDNFGFSFWAHQNKEELMKLGVGTHFGEWYGSKIGRGYGMNEKRFALFNTHRWSDDAVRPACCDVVPVLYTGPFHMEHVHECLNVLQVKGSCLVPGFMRPEGIVVFHTAANNCFKVTIVNDGIPKSQAAKEAA